MSDESLPWTLLLVALAALVAVSILAHTRYANDKQAVCRFVHGQWHSDVCIKDGRVVKVTP